MERISSGQNAIVKRFRDLARASRTVTSAGHSGEVLLDGEHLVQEALACDIPVEIAAFSDEQLNNVLSPVARIAKDVKKRARRSLPSTPPLLAPLSPPQH